MNLTKKEMLTHSLRHRYSGNGFAVVEFCPTTVSTLTGQPTEYVRVTDRYCKTGQALLAAVDHLEIETISPGVDKEFKPLPSEPVLLTAEDLAKLTPLREGIYDGTMKIVSTYFVKQKQPATV